MRAAWWRDAPRGSAVRQLIVGFTVLTVLLLVAGGVRWAMIGQLTTSARILTETVYPAGAANTRALQALTDAETGIRGYQLTADVRFLDAYHRGSAEFRPALDDAFSHAADPTLRRLLQTEHELGERWLTEFAAPIAAGPGGPAAVSTAWDAIGKQWTDRFRAAHREAQAWLADKQDQVVRTISRLVPIADVTTVVLSLISVGFVLVLAVRVVRGVGMPLTNLTRTLRRLAAAEHGARARVSGPAELREAGISLNTLAEENDRLRRLQQQQLETRALARAIGSAIGDALETDVILQEVVDRLGAAMHADRVWIRLGGSIPRAAQWHRPGLEPMLLDRTAPGKDLSRQVGVTDEARGVISVELDPRRLVTDDDRQLLDLVVEDLNRALHHAALHAQQRAVVAELQALDRHKDEFVSTISHELRTPLTSIQGYLEAIQDDMTAIPPAQQRMLGVVDRNARRLLNLVEDLLTLSQVEAASSELEKRPVRIASVVDLATTSLAPMATAANLSFTVDNRARDAHVAGDPELLERALLHLLSNAIKFTPGPGHVTIRCAIPSSRPGHVEITISDTGMGIPVEDQANLFRRFYRAANASEQAIQGSGLGLAITRSIVEGHGGDITLVSELDQGTHVTISLPVSLTPALI
ncbi:signal transduction histidine kinase [Catenuloplanes nepalensis]|uniref:Sensor-like histidine kinase SenX3 n=1 Tax=Catenuloplanes nepalensis TaxID=587533 RepID=A0ABT9MYS0_9ACTN|nr:ATP-binding protein [Catenuloplanes nepalensis]MDP9796595.1 signal transduction histidine kinase [Catenuloplanes nepalensis]